jgi:hypothetical protein
MASSTKKTSSSHSNSVFAAPAKTAHNGPGVCLSLGRIQCYLAGVFKCTGLSGASMKNACLPGFELLLLFQVRWGPVRWVICRARSSIIPTMQMFPFIPWVFLRTRSVELVGRGGLVAGLSLWHGPGLAAQDSDNRNGKPEHKELLH